MRLARHFVNMVSIHTLPEDKTASTSSSTSSVPTNVLHPEDEVYDLDLPPYPPCFSHFLVFHLDEDIWFLMSAMMNWSSMEKPMSKGSSAQRNTNCAQRRADQEHRQLVPNNLDDAFDMVGNQQVFKTPSANVAV